MGHVESKTRSLGQILEKPCARSRDFILVKTHIKHGQNAFAISRTSMKMGHVGSKTRSLGQI